MTDADRVRLGAQAANLVHEEDGALYMVMRKGRCVALTVVEGTFVCSVYAHRPAICRELDRGTPACREERAAKLPSAMRWLSATTLTVFGK